MTKTKYGTLADESFEKYIHSLINKVYKILPMKEENSETLKSYLDSFLIELIGCQKLFDVLKNEPQFGTIITTITYLANKEYSVATCRKEVFKCIHILSRLNEKYFNEVYAHE